MGGALDNLCVVDFSRVLAGPYATMVMADLGATVVKVERPVTGDDTREWGPPYDASGEATYFLAVNRNKDSLVLDLAEAGDVAIAQELCIDADVVVENFRPGVMERLGLGYDDLSRRNPGLIYCSITGFGAAAGARFPGYDLLVQALGGLMSITGDPDGEPQKVGVALVDVLAGLYATVGILSALQHRNVSGTGQRVEVDLLTALLASLVNQASAYTAAGVTPRRMGNRHPSIAPYQVFRTGDGVLVLAVGNDRQFAQLCSVLGTRYLAVDERFVTNAARVEHRHILQSELERALARRAAAAWAPDLLAAGVPAGVVQDIPAAFRLAEKLGLDPIVRTYRPDGTVVELPRSPIKLSRTPATYRSAPPRLGAGGQQERADEPTIANLPRRGTR